MIHLVINNIVLIINKITINLLKNFFKKKIKSFLKYQIIKTGY